MKSDYVTVRRYESESSNRVYSVKFNKLTLALSCNCPGWIFKRNGQARRCKHIEWTLAEAAAKVA